VESNPSQVELALRGRGRTTVLADQFGSIYRTIVIFVS
jgi:hypothetical protein